jgi:hypothetical protein
MREEGLSMAEEVEACRLDPSGPDWFEIYPDPRHLRGRRALILDLWRIPAQRVMAGFGGTRRKEQMATLDEIGQEKQRISERLARLDGERTKLGDQLNELEIAERILARFGGKAEATERRRRGRPARTAPAAGGERSARRRQQAPAVSMSDAILKAVQEDDGATANTILDYMSREFGMTVRPNHLGIALQRHRRAGRLENRDQRWYLPSSAQGQR